MKFPFQAKLVQEPDSTSRPDMTVGKEYTIIGWAGSCFITTCDVPGETRMVHYGRFEELAIAT